MYFFQSSSTNIEYSTVCPGSSDPFYMVTYYLKWVTTSWTYSSAFIALNTCSVRMEVAIQSASCVPAILILENIN